MDIAEVEIVLVTFSGALDPHDELERHMEDIGFTLEGVHFVGETDLTPTDLEAKIRNEVFPNLTLSHDNTVHAKIVGKAIHHLPRVLPK